MKSLTIRLLVGLAAVLTLVGCSGAVDAGLVDGEGAASAPHDADAADAGERTTADAAGTGEADTTVVRLYYLAAADGASSGEGLSLTAVDREIPATPRIARATLQALIGGPTASEDEGSDALTSAVPASTVVRGVTVDDGLATVDLSGAFESGGGSASMHARLAQLVYTVTQFPTVDAVALVLDGQPVEVFSGEGLLLDGPLGRDEVDGMWR